MKKEFNFNSRPFLSVTIHKSLIKTAETASHQLQTIIFPNKLHFYGLLQFTAFTRHL